MSAPDESFAMEDALIAAVDRKRQDDATVKEWRQAAGVLRDWAEEYVPQVFDWLDAELAARSPEGLSGFVGLTTPLDTGTYAEGLSGLLLSARKHVPSPCLADEGGPQ